MKNFGLLNQSEKKPGLLDPWSVILPAAFDLVCGILLIILGDLALRVTSYALAGLMIVCAVVQLVKYFRSSTLEKITEFRLAGGLALAFSGVLLAFSPEYLKDFLPFIWGLAMFFGAFVKVQYAFGEKLLGIEKWWIMLIFAAFSLTIGIISLTNPAFLGENRPLIVGIMLVVEAVLDVVVFLMINNALKKNPPADVPLPAAEQKAIEAAVKNAVASASAPASEAAPASPSVPEQEA